jgi:N-acetyl-gamma-glutamyl-phosphate reductase
LSIANPGCFATCIQLALLPLAGQGLLSDDIHVNATTGSTGAGQSLSDTTHFSWRDSNISVYKAFNHQHLGEIRESLASVQGDYNKDIHFIPQRGNFTRGILSSVYMDCDLDIGAVTALYESYYAAHPFIRISPKEVDVKQVVNTNRCFLHLEKHNNKLLITSVIDNLLKGAAGQAVQNMNLIFGLDESAGLHLKPSAF